MSKEITAEASWEQGSYFGLGRHRWKIDGIWQASSVGSRQAADSSRNRASGKTFSGGLPDIPPGFGRLHADEFPNRIARHVLSRFD